MDSVGGCVEQRPQTSEVANLTLRLAIITCFNFQEQYWEKAVLDIDPSAIVTLGDLGEIRLQNMRNLKDLLFTLP